MKDLIFLIHSGATLFLAGLIWTIQIVHYPLFANVGTDYSYPVVFSKGDVKIFRLPSAR